MCVCWKIKVDWNRLEQIEILGESHVPTIVQTIPYKEDRIDGNPRWSFLANYLPLLKPSWTFDSVIFFSLTEESRDEIAPLDLCSLHFDLYLGPKSQTQL